MEPIIQLIMETHQIDKNPTNLQTTHRLCEPLILDQVIYCPLSILDPYLFALHKNYYYPLAMLGLEHMEDKHRLYFDDVG
jgi:hypothetical protein